MYFHEEVRSLHRIIDLGCYITRDIYRVHDDLIDYSKIFNYDKDKNILICYEWDAVKFIYEKTGEIADWERDNNEDWGSTFPDQEISEKRIKRLEGRIKYLERICR